MAPAKDNEFRAVSKVIKSLPQAVWKGAIEAGKGFGPVGAALLGFFAELQDACNALNKEDREEFLRQLRAKRLRDIEEHIVRLGGEQGRITMSLAGALKAIAELSEFQQGQAIDVNTILLAIFELRGVSRREKLPILRELRNARNAVANDVAGLDDRAREVHRTCLVTLAKLDDMEDLLVRAVRTARDAEQQEFEQRYLRELARKYQDIELLGIGALDQTLELGEAFVSLSLTEDGGMEGRATDANTILAGRDELVVVGSAGAGKSTLLQWETLQCLEGERLAGARRNPWHGCIPFFIPLRKLQSGEAFPPSEQWARLSVDGWAGLGEHHGAWVQDVLEKGRALLTLDGLDELPPGSRQAFWRELKKLIRHYDLIYRVSSRPFHRPGVNDAEWGIPVGATSAEVLPLSESKINRLIDKCHYAAAREATSPKAQEALQKYPEELKNKLWKQSAYRKMSQLAQTPLLCAAICLINRYSNEKLPANRREFFKLLCVALLERDDLKMRGDKMTPVTGPAYNTLPSDVLVHMHAHLAFSMMMNPKEGTEALGSDYLIQATRDTVLDWLDDAIGYIPDQGMREQAKSAPDELLTHLVDRRNLLREPGLGWIDFHHRALQEYLTASALGRMKWLDFLAERAEAHDDRWTDTIVLSAGGYFAGDEFGNELIKTLLERGKAKDSRACRSLAVACLDTAVLVKPDVREEALAALDKILPPRSHEEVKDIMAAGDAAVPLLAHDRWSEDEEAEAFCGLALMLIGSEAAKKALGEGYGVDAILKTVVRAPGTNVLELPPILEEVKKNGALPEFALEYVRELEPLQALTELTTLNFCDCDKVIDLAPLAKLTRLRSLDLQGCKGLADSAPIHSAGSAGSPASFSSFRSLSEFRALNLAECDGIGDFTPLSALRQLECLDLSHCTQVQDLSFLEPLTNLRTLSLRCCAGIQSVAPLAKLAQLESLDLAYCEALTDLTPIHALPNLRLVHLQGCPAPVFEPANATPPGTPGMDYVEIVAGVPMPMVWVEGGTFQMGSPDDEENRFRSEGPVHAVTLDGYWMAATAVVQALYEAVTSENPSHFRGADNPVECISWHDAIKFCESLSQQTGRPYSLPTEAQWEYACRAGTSTRFCFGDFDSRLGRYACYDDNAKGKTQPVGRRRPNALGLRDMHSNVFEWCQDWFAEYTSEEESNPTGPKDGANRVLRGGCWRFGSRDCRAACRYYRPFSGSSYVGFRVVALSRTQT